MAEFFRIYKGENVVDEGESPLSISNLEPNTDVEKGEFQAVRVKTEGEGEDREENESDRVDIPSFKTLPIEVTGVSLDNTELELEKGGTSTLKATVEPSNATEKGVNWKSDNTDVAKVSGGKVTAVAEGKANITVTTKDGGKTATCAVTVTEPEEPDPEDPPEDGDEGSDGGN